MVTRSRSVFGAIGASALLALASPASAALLITPNAATISVGSHVTFTITEDFIGDLDGVISYVGTSVSYDSSLLEYVGGDGEPADFPVGFTLVTPDEGFFGYTATAPVSGSGIPILYLSFKALGPGIATISVEGSYTLDDPDAELIPFNGSGSVEIVRDVGNAVPEPASWAMMIVGFGLVGGAIRTGRSRRTSLA